MTKFHIPRQAPPVTSRGIDGCETWGGVRSRQTSVDWRTEFVLCSQSVARSIEPIEVLLSRVEYKIYLFWYRTDIYPVGAGAPYSLQIFGQRSSEMESRSAAACRTLDIFGLVCTRIDRPSHERGVADWMAHHERLGFYFMSRGR